MKYMYLSLLLTILFAGSSYTFEHLGAERVFMHKCKGQLTLRAATIIPFSQQIPPRAIRAYNDSLLVLIDGIHGALFTMSTSGNRSPLDMSHAYVAIGSGENRIFATNGTSLYWWSFEGDSGRRRIKRDFSRTEQIISLFAAHGRIWISTVGTNGARIHRIDAVTGRSLNEPIRFQGPAIVHSAPKGGAIAAMIGYPYKVIVYDSRGNVRIDIATADVLNWDVSDRNLAAVYTTSALPLDCGRVLHVLADLKSDKRYFVLYDSSGSLIRQTSFNRPIGIVESLYPEHHILVGFRDLPEWRGIVLFTWAWNVPREISGG